MVEVPVRINGIFDRRVGNSVERLFEMLPRRSDEIVDDQFALRAVEHHNISARTRQQREMVREFLRLNGNGAHLRAECRGWIGGGLLSSRLTCRRDKGIR